ncbi:MAG TPA: class I tRNA ligase family protein, partial [Candidatus Peribacterales bacterium]|nr:class I tRNA ligase family protein [Candidatus Peribacterales bacterium]
MPLVLFNTLTKQKEKFVPLEKGKVKIYTCGPTVYGRPHIGNYASFLMADLLRRVLEFSGYEVTHVKNITDVGHLTADSAADAGGEDKIEKKAREEKLDPLLIAERYTKEYLADEKALNMVEPEFRPRATETIKEMIAIIQTLLKKGNAYETRDGIYFAIESFPGYGKLSGNTLANLGKLEEGVRIELKETKKHPADFALWKKCVGE